jgi:hypothetical protein
MSNDTIITVRKIQLVIDSKGKEFVSEAYKTLYHWQYCCFRAANYISTHCYLQEQLKELIYLTDDAKVKLADIHKDPDGILVTSKLNSTSRILSRNFKGEIPMHILSSLNMTMVKYFNHEKISYLKGERAIRSYKKDIPIPFRGADITHLQKVEDKSYFSFRLFKMPFRTYLGKDFTDKRQLLQQVIDGQIKLCTSSIKLEKNKIFLLAVFEIPKPQTNLDTAIIAEASLSMEYPLTVQIGSSRYYIGNKEEFLYRRLAMQAAMQRVQKGAAFNHSQRGRKRKLKAVINFKEKEKDYIQNKLHLYSRLLINLCIKHRAATLLLVNQEEKEANAKQNEFLLRNWSFYTLKEKILYKAVKAGIEVITE